MTTILCDGACGTALGAIQAADLLCRTEPERVRDLHQNYKKAGSQVVRTCTFNTMRLGDPNLLEAAARAIEGIQAQVWWSMWPSPDGDRGSISHVARLCKGKGRLHFETVTSLDALRLALETARRHAPSMSVSASAFLCADNRLPDGNTLRDFAHLALAEGVDILGLNCMSVTDMARMLPEMQSIAGDAKTGVFPSGEPGWSKKMARHILPLAPDYVGGCCGTTPRDICELGRFLLSSCQFPTMQ